MRELVVYPTGKELMGVSYSSESKESLIKKANTVKGPWVLYGPEGVVESFNIPGETIQDLKTSIVSMLSSGSFSRVEI